MKKLLLIDADCGVDDAQAIMIALGAPNVEVLGITCCYGNSALENTCRNTLRVLHVCDKLEVLFIFNYTRITNMCCPIGLAKEEMGTLVLYRHALISTGVLLKNISQWLSENVDMGEHLPPT